jgi:DNA repair protein RAD50
MSTIDKLGIIGVRSYDPNHLEYIEFFKPLTIIWGHNGSGKTVPIS